MYARTEGKHLNVKDIDCVLMPSVKSANRCRDFIVKACGVRDDDGGLISVDNCIDSVDDFCGDSSSEGDGGGDSSSGSGSGGRSGRRRKVNVFKIFGDDNVCAVIFPADTNFAIEAKVGESESFFLCCCCYCLYSICSILLAFITRRRRFCFFSSVSSNLF